MCQEWLVAAVCKILLHPELDLSMDEAWGPVRAGALWAVGEPLMISSTMPVEEHLQ